MVKAPSLCDSDGALRVVLKKNPANGSFDSECLTTSIPVAGAKLASVIAEAPRQIDSLISCWLERRRGHEGHVMKDDKCLKLQLWQM